MNEIDLLWQKIDADPSQITAPELSKVISWYRKLQADHAAGIKTSKRSGEEKVDITDLVEGLKAKAVATQPKIKRRF